MNWRALLPYVLGALYALVIVLWGEAWGLAGAIVGAAAVVAVHKIGGHE